MSMMKVIEVLANSPDGFDKATEAAVTKASDSVRNIKSVYVKEMIAKVENGKITSYGVNAKITFELDGQSAT